MSCCAASQGSWADQGGWAGSGGTNFSLIYRPGGVPQGNVVTDETTLWLRIAAIPGPVTVYFDDTIAPCVLHGVHTVAFDMQWSGWTLGVNTNLTLADGFRLASTDGGIGLSLVTWDLQITSQNSNAASGAFVPTISDVLAVEYGSSLKSAGNGGPVFRVDGGAGGGLTFALHNAATFGDGAHAVVNLVAAGAAQILLFDDTTLANDSIQGAVGTTFTIDVVSTSAKFTVPPAVGPYPSQPLMLGTINVVYESNASNIGYTPATPANWRSTLPTLVSQALDYLVALVTLMRVWTATATTTLYVDNSAGSDVSGIGTALLPFASIARALQVRGFMPADNTVVPIQLVTTGLLYTVDSGVKSTSYTRIQSAGLAVQSARTFTTTTGSTDVGIVGTIDGVAPGNDALLGQWAAWSSGPLAGQYGLFVKNVGATCYISSSDPSGAYTNPNGSTLNIVKPPVTIAMSKPWVIEETFGFSLREVTVDGGGFNLVCSATNFVSFTRCYLTDIDSLIAHQGAANLTTTMLQGTGDGASSGTIPGVALARAGSTFFMFEGSCVMQTPGAGSAYAAVAIYGLMSTQGESWFRELNGATIGGIYVNGGVVQGRATNQDGSANVWRFVGLTVPCVQVNKGAEGVGGDVDCARMTNGGGGNATTAAYIVTAKGGAHVIVNGGTAQGSGNALAVSADDGATNTSSNSDGTQIVGGSPNGGYHYNQAFPGFNPTVTLATGERTVFGDFNLKNDATHDATVQCEVETGIGTNVYTIVAQKLSLSQPSVPTNPDTFTYNFPVPAGRRYRFTPTTGGGATVVAGNYGYKDV